MSIGKRIHIVREQKGMTMEELAKLCKTTKQTIFKYENEIVTNIPYEKIVLLSNALDVTPSYLFGWEEPAKSYDIVLTDEERRILLALREKGGVETLAKLLGINNK